jgi:choline monooxygenase
VLAALASEDCGVSGPSADADGRSGTIARHGEASDVSIEPFPVDPDIRRARTIDPRVFGDPAVHRALLQGPFARSWQLVRLGDPASDPATTAAGFTLLPGALDEPLVWTRERPAGDAAAAPERILSNVCTHRANLVVDEPRAGARAHRGRELVCGYHGRRFGLDGRFRSMPAFEETLDFPCERDDLPELELARLGPLRFTRLARGISFDVWSAPLAALLREFDGEALVFAPERTRDYDVDASWALYVENYLEGFHVPFVHKGLDTVLDPGTYRTELFAHAVRQVGVARPGSSEPTMRRANEPNVAGDYLWLWPNLMVNAYPWGISANLVEPTSPATCRVRYLSWVARPELLDRGAGAGLDTVEHEDEGVVERVQRGVRARLYRRGRFSPTREQGPHWFERLLARELEALASGDGSVC